MMVLAKWHAAVAQLADIRLNGYARVFFLAFTLVPLPVSVLN
jgi:hypothetical protein